MYQPTSIEMHWQFYFIDTVSDQTRDSHRALDKNLVIRHSKLNLQLNLLLRLNISV